MTAPAIIHDLVNRFRDSRELYRSGRYNEAQLRQEFLNPLFETLGWDMYNRSNFAPQYREVIHEDSLEDEGSLKAPDYAFRIGTTRKFFVEAKKPAVDIRYAIHPAYQLRRYAWNAHLPLSILTDFEELAVYDCRTRPDPKDSAATGRVMLFTFEDYLTRWDELAQIFSKDAVWNGSFDRYAEGSKGKRGTTEVDAEFLKEIEQWRLLLARNIALRNFRGSVIASEKDPPPTPPPTAKRGLERVKNTDPPTSSIVPEKKVADRLTTPSEDCLRPTAGGSGDEGGGSSSEKPIVPESSPSTIADRQGSIPANAHLTPASRTLSKERADSIAPSGEGDEGGGSSTLSQDGLRKQPPNLHRAERQLNYAVQTTIDRILFLRICEDRQIEPTDQLLQIAEGSDIYTQLLLLFQKADQKYNSGLFHFNKEKGQTSEPDTFTPTLQIDDKVLRQVIKSTYYPCPYMFNEIPVEILGQVYEQFLGSVIRLTPGGQAKVEEKPEVRKAGGVYYTPRYIVDYIVQNTIGRLLGDSTVGETPALVRVHGLPASEAKQSPESTTEKLETIRSNPVLGGDTGTIGRSNPVLGANTGTNDVVKPSSTGGGSVSVANGGEGDEGGGSLNSVPASLSTEKMETIRSNSVLGQETGTNDVVKPSSTGGGSMSAANGGEGDAEETIRSNPVLGQETGTNSDSLTPSSPSLGREEGDEGRSPAEGGCGSLNSVAASLSTEKMETIRSNPVLGQETGTIMTPAQALNLRVVDPACGSGSFLLGAYQYLLDWHLNYYLTHDPQSHTQGKNPPLVATDGGEYRLTTETKKRILTSNIYGVDIDAQAVEVTKLSLLLKLLEGETGQLTLGFERVLPDLGQNIRCGNSLIGWDYFQGQMFPDEEEIQRVNPFDWQRAFPHVFAEGGFDAVIGNPPYFNIDSTWGKKDPRLEALKRQYPEVYRDKTDVLFYFIALGIRIVKGCLGFIVSRAFMEAYKADKLRSYITQNMQICEIIDFQNKPIFEGIGISTLILVMQKKPASCKGCHYRLLVPKQDLSNLEHLLQDNSVFESLEITQDQITDKAWVFIRDKNRSLFAKIDENSQPIGSFMQIGSGMQTGANGVFGNKTFEEIQAWKLVPKQYFKRAANSDIQPFNIIDRQEYIIFTNAFDSVKQLHPELQSYFQANSAKLKGRAAYKRGNCQWWQYTWPLNWSLYRNTRILSPYMAKSNRFAIDTNDEFLSLTDTTVIFDSGQEEDLYYILGLLNTELLTNRYKSIGKLKGGGIFEYVWNSVSKMPIKRIDFSITEEVALHDQIVNYSKQITELLKQKPTTPREMENQKRVYAFLHSEIEKLAMILYTEVN